MKPSPLVGRGCGFSLFLGILWGGILVSTFAKPIYAKEAPNVLFILTEDQGAHLSFLETPGLQTPNIDSLAKSGVYFHNAFVNYPVCSASKGSIYTGLFPHANGILNNTHNFHMPADQVTAAQRELKLARTNRVRNHVATLTEILNFAGYFQGVTHKLHVLPNEKFPYDRFMKGSPQEIRQFISTAKEKAKPWFLLVNIPNSHRPYPNSDQKAIRVRPSEVKLPQFLPESPEVRKDWAEYLAGVEQADALTGQAIEIVKQAGELDSTIVIFMSDHGPTFQHGKMTLYDLGLRVPLIIRGPGIPAGRRRDCLASGVDVLPTLLELCEIRHEFPYPIHGQSIAHHLVESAGLSSPTKIRSPAYVFAEISNRGPLPNDGIQERSVFDGRWKLIYRENVAKQWRQVNADSRQFKVWGNRSYAETIRLKDRFPRQYQILAEMDPQNLDGRVPRLELYDLETDPDEMRNLCEDPMHIEQRERLMSALKDWVRRTEDVSVSP